MSAGRRLLLGACAALLLTAAWIRGGRELYRAFFGWAAAPLLERAGVTAIAESPATERFVAVLPFAVLMLLSPGLGLRRRLIGLAGGLLSIFAAQIALVLAEAWIHAGRGPTPDAFSALLPLALLVDALPFVLWALLAAPVLRRLLASPRERAERPGC